MWDNKAIMWNRGLRWMADKWAGAIVSWTLSNSGAVCALLAAAFGGVLYRYHRAIQQLSGLTWMDWIAVGLGTLFALGAGILFVRFVWLKFKPLPTGQSQTIDKPHGLLTTLGTLAALVLITWLLPRGNTGSKLPDATKPIAAQPSDIAPQKKKEEKEQKTRSFVAQPSSSTGTTGVQHNESGATGYQANGPGAIGQQINIGSEPVNNPVVPNVSVTTQVGLTLTDFPNLSISENMEQHLRRNVLTVRNPNTIPLTDFVMRFQFPEPVIDSLVTEDLPPGIDTSWHACRMSFALNGIGQGASVEPTPEGGTKITTAPAAGSGGVLSGNGEVCSAAMDNKKLRATSNYQLRIARLPATTSIRIAFLTEPEPNSSESMQHFLASIPNALLYFGNGSFQYSSRGQTESRSVFVPLQFDRRLRNISSLPSSEDHSKWTPMTTMN
jgi:hypothetical protein